MSDSSSNRLRWVTPTGAVGTLAGSGVGALVDGIGTAAAFRAPCGLAMDPVGGLMLFVADRDNHAVRAVDTGSGAVSTLAGSGASGFVDAAGAAARFNSPFGLTLTPNRAALDVRFVCRSGHAPPSRPIVWR